jgi:HSP20 family protein|tara:strand:- start:1425 stop:1862 length:438 start_codon:yes stop_codon:yes gene_type:complete
MTLIKWTPINTINRDFDHMLDRIFNDGWNNNNKIRNNPPSVDIIENEEEFVLTAELPGFDKKNLNIKVEENGVLRINANTKINIEPNDPLYRIRERNSGSSNRRFNLPENAIVDKINAQFKNGLLTVNIPKAKEIKSESKKIKIS